jgi:two-component system cell cycle sensor histidine kinase/response regulator CckA
MGRGSQIRETNVEMNTHPAPAGGTADLPPGAAGIVARLQKLAESIPEALLILDGNDRIVAINNRFLELFGLQPDLPCPQGLDDLKSGLQDCFGDQEVFARRWEALKTWPVELANEEWEIVKPLHRLLRLQISLIPPPAGTAQQPERIFLWRDHTDIRNLQATLQQAQKMEAIGILAGGIAHNFNNLLTAITGNLGLALQQLQSAGSSPEVNSLLADAFKAAAGGRELVKQLLCHARHSPHSIQSTDLRTLVTDVRDLLKHSISALVKVDLQLPRNLWPALADRSDVQQVLMNLCVNAIDAMKGRKNSEILIVASNQPRTSPPEGVVGAGQGDYVCIEVQDNGPGIPSTVMQRLFEPFFTTKPLGEGTGLGLSSSKDIVEKLGGWMECDSQLGQGASFAIFLPRGTPPKEVAVAAVPLSLPKPSGTEVILVVDDDPLVRNVSKRLLTGAGYQVFTACDGQEAVDWMSSPSNRADLVLLDVAMPRLSGPDAMVEIRKMKPGLPVVLCSGFLFDPSAFRDAHGMLPDASLYKPYEVGELTGTVRSVLDKHLAPPDAALPS